MPEFHIFEEYKNGLVCETFVGDMHGGPLMNGVLVVGNQCIDN